MELFAVKTGKSGEKNYITDDMFLTREYPTTAGSKMLEKYLSPFDAETILKMEKAGYTLIGKAKSGELNFDALGETAILGACVENGILKNAAAEIVAKGDCVGALMLDANGTGRRAAAQTGLVFLKPTYGTVSRYGVIAVACSGDTVSVMAKNGNTCGEMLEAIVGKDEKDGTMIPDAVANQKKQEKFAKGIKKVAVLKSMLKGDKEVLDNLQKRIDNLKKHGIEVQEIDDEVVCLANVAWNILMCAEMCNNVSRYDGVKYGHRAKEYTDIDELYKNSRTEGFGMRMKEAILYGSETLATEKYDKQYDKALRVRRAIVNQFSKIFENFDGVLMPTCSKLSYSEKEVKENDSFVFEENFYTAPSSISGLPCVVAGGVQLVGSAFSEKALLASVDFLVEE